MKTYLLTGANGFIGRNVLKGLLENNVKVKIVLRNKSNIIEYLSNSKIEIISTDNIFNKDFNWWVPILKGVDVVIHAAWYTEHGKYLNSSINFDCLLGTLNLLKAIQISKINHFIGIGSCFEYDFNYSNKPFNIYSPTKAVSPYIISKLSVFNAIKLLKSTSNFNFSWCRVFYLYGEGEDSRRLIPYINNCLTNSVKVVLNNAHSIRDYINVIDASKMIVQISLNEKTGIFNICSGYKQTIKSLATNIAKKYNKVHLIQCNDNEKSLEPNMILGIPSL